MTPLWTAAEAEAAAGGCAQGGWAATGVSIDSRSLQPGDLFVALADGRDGHDFAAAALEKGAAAALVSRIPEGVAEDAPLLLVQDTLEALRRLGAVARARLDAAARVIAVTGSVGKTGVKEMLRLMLAEQGPTHAAEKSYNNHWGAPLTLARTPRDTRFAVLELGMNHPGEIGPLSRLCAPDVALVTTIAPAHLGHFREEAEIADAKAEIFEGLARDGVAILNRDNRWFNRLREAAAPRRVVDFGETAEAARLVSAETASGATLIRARIDGRALLCKLGAPGRHLALNALGALAAAEAAGADLAACALALQRWRAPEGRGARWDIALGPAGMDGAVRLIDDSYNANPASVSAALAVLAAEPVKDGVGRVAKGRRIACLGDMMELGENETALHAALADDPAMPAIDSVLCVGERMRALHDALAPAQRGGCFPNAAAAAQRLRRIRDAGDVILVKGSLSMQMARVVDALRASGAARPADATEES